MKKIGAFIVMCVVAASCSASQPRELQAKTEINDRCYPQACIIGYHWDKHFCGCVPN